MKEFLGGKRIATDEMKETVMNWLNGMAADFYDGGRGLSILCKVLRNS
jgi:hypothetical protein